MNKTDENLVQKQMCDQQKHTRGDGEELVDVIDSDYSQSIYPSERGSVKANRSIQPLLASGKTTVRRNRDTNL